jgi:hypothetical protein
MTQPPEDHIKALWQGQETETPEMTATAIRALARNYGDNLRGRIWLGVAVAAAEVLIFGAFAWKAQNEVLRTGWLIILAGVGWMTWRIVSKRPGRLPPAEASPKALIEFHRAELERQRTNFTWVVVTTAPVFAGMVVTLIGLHIQRPNMSLANVLPVALLAIAWWFAAIPMQRRQARRLAEQIAEMDDLAGR